METPTNTQNGLDMPCPHCGESNGHTIGVLYRCNACGEYSDAPNQFSTDPDVVLPLVKGGTINRHQVIDAASSHGYVFVLCYRADSSDRPYVTWSVWRTEEGKIAAALGHYFEHLPEAVIGLYRRAHKWQELRAMEDQILKTVAGRIG